MDREVIEQKLESLRYCVRRIQQKCPAQADALARDLDAQDIISFNLTRAVQLCVDLGAYLIADRDFAPPDTVGHIFDALAEIDCIDRALADRLKKAVGFRNIAVHNYLAIDWQIVHTIAQTHVDDFIHSLVSSWFGTVTAALLAAAMADLSLRPRTSGAGTDIVGVSCD